jgi:hypothetical protein
MLTTKHKSFLVFNEESRRTTPTIKTEEQRHFTDTKSVGSRTPKHQSYRKKLWCINNKRKKNRKRLNLETSYPMAKQ